MHILLEGVLPYTIKAMLKSYVYAKQYVTIYDINDRMSHFKYSRAEAKNKPSQISSNNLNEDGRLNQTGIHIILSWITNYVICVLPYTASQMWNLAVYLPIFIGDEIPDDDDEWECYLLLLDILKICVSCVLSVDIIDYLKVLIELYLNTFRDCYPHMNIIPKQHYLIHLPTQMLKYVMYVHMYYFVHTYTYVYVTGLWKTYYLHT